MKRLPLCFKVAAGCLAAGFVLSSGLPARAQTDPIPPTAVRPEIRIITPANNAVFFAPVDIPIFAYVDTTFYGGTTNVEFFANGVKLGNGVDLGVAMPPSAVAFPLYRTVTPGLAANYCFVWTNVPVGTNVLTAVAQGRSIVTSNVSILSSRTSAPVTITVIATVTPPTNAPDVVSIVATDPIAIAGTNLWYWPGPTNPTPVWSNWPPPITVKYTNWGPKSALMTVRRFGDATDALTVDYAISGTASNGVDYAKLPGFVTIPAGGAYALIPIVPLNETNPIATAVPAKTVVLTLSPDTNTPPDYKVGIPPRATALILHEWPRPLPLLLADASFHLNAPAPDGAWFVVETSPDLVSWSPVCTNQAFQGSIDYVDGNAAVNGGGYYRAVPMTGATPTQ